MFKVAGRVKTSGKKLQGEPALVAVVTLSTHVQEVIQLERMRGFLISSSVRHLVAADKEHAALDDLLV